LNLRPLGPEPSHEPANVPVNKWITAAGCLQHAQREGPQQNFGGALATEPIRKTRGVTMRMPWNSLIVRRSGSPVTIIVALPSIAAAKYLSSSASTLTPLTLFLIRGNLDGCRDRKETFFDGGHFDLRTSGSRLRAISKVWFR
jgi:hypothetical protein